MARFARLLILVAISLLVVGCSLEVTSVSTNPPTIFYYVTVRSFMMQPCRAALLPARSNRCPNVPSIVTDVINGKYSGHPDFQANDGDQLFPLDFTSVMNYNGKYANFSQAFPLTAGGTARPFVLSDLQPDSTGIPKMRYCLGEEGYLCDYNKTVSPKMTLNATSFSTWHQDDPYYNIRSGYKQNLYLNGSQYGFDSTSSTQNPLLSSGKGFYSPMVANGVPGWPQGLYESTFGSGNYKFSFTTEIHTSFQYQGGEIFFFSGDDDVHVYINSRLAVNLGGVHERATVTLNLTKYERELGLELGKIYPFDLFQAERHTEESNYALTTTLSAACNVVNTDFRTSGVDVEIAIDWQTVGGKTGDADWFVLGILPQNPIIDSLSAPNIGNLLVPGLADITTYMFHSKQHNVGSGFSLSFSFKMKGSSGHGFSVLIHNRAQGLENFNGGSGPNLGIKNTDNSLAIAFDSCAGFNATSGGCNNTKTQVRLHYNLQGDKFNSVANSTLTRFDPDVKQNWRDDVWHTVLVLYHATPDWLEVYVDNSLRLVEKNFSMQNVTGSLDAYIGFAASSSSQAKNLSVSIANVTMKTVKVVSRRTLSVDQPGEGVKTFIANGRDKVRFSLQTRDACLNLITYGGLSNLTQGRMVATSVDPRPISSGRRLVDNGSLIFMPEINDLDNGQYELAFTADILANFTVHMSFGENCTWNGTAFTPNNECFVQVFPNAATSIPFSTFAPTADFAPEGLGTAALSGIGVAGGVIAVVGTIALIVGIRLRNRWRKEKVFVDEGRRVVAERGVIYEGDSELDVLQNQLQATLHAIQQERARNLKAEDKEDVIRALMRERGELQEMIRRKKILKQGGDPDSEPEPFARRMRMSVAATRKSFAPSRLSRGSSRSIAGKKESMDAGDPNDGAVFSATNPIYQGFIRAMPNIRASMHRRSLVTSLVVAKADMPPPPPPPGDGKV